MEVFKLIESSRCGFLRPRRSNRIIEHLMLKKLFSEERFMRQTKFSGHASDFSLLTNRLLVAHSNNRVSCYDVTKPMRSGFKCLKIWAIQSGARTGLECIHWHSGGDFFTYSAKDAHIYCVDVETMIVVDEIEVKRSLRICEHKPSPHNPEMVAVASPLAEVFIVDLKSGSSTCTAPLHPRGVLSISWSGLSENLLVTAGENGVLFWDIRQFRRPMFVSGDDCTRNDILPSFQMCPVSDKIVLLNPNRCLTVWDAGRLKRCSHCGPFYGLNADRSVRYKFTLSGLREPGLIFMPENQDINIYDFTTMDMVGTLQLGHIMPIHNLYFNNAHCQLYSSAADGSLAWVPKPLLSDICWENCIPNNE